MKPINEMTLREVIDALRTFASRYENCVLMSGDEPVIELSELSDRIHDLTRWIPVSERLPTEADADRHGYIIIRDVENESPKRVYHGMAKWSDIGKPNYFYTVTDWKQIEP